MACITYVAKELRGSSLALVDRANSIIAEYRSLGFTLTLRQLYYQFVSRDLLRNTMKEYKRLGSVINDARLAGLIDWNAIEDRTRGVRGSPHWESPKDIVSACAQQFRLDKWADQVNYVEVWVEKDALVGIVEKACLPLDVNYLACRGYTSQSEMWESAMRMVEKSETGRVCHVIHLGDHDPSGVDMTRDIMDRLALFCQHHDVVPPDVHRIALTIEQVHQQKPPPNPAKLSDSRATGYIRKHGSQSWELDALDPAYLSRLIRKSVEGLMDRDLFEAIRSEEDAHQKEIKSAADNWDHVVSSLRQHGL